MAVKCADLTKYTWEVEGESITVGGCVHSMAWDPLGQRLAVVFKGAVDFYLRILISSCISVYSKKKRLNGIWAELLKPMLVSCFGKLMCRRPSRDC